MSGTDPRHALGTRVESLRRALANADPDERANRSNHHDPINTMTDRHSMTDRHTMTDHDTTTSTVPFAHRSGVTTGPNLSNVPNDPRTAVATERGESGV